MSILVFLVHKTKTHIETLMFPELQNIDGHQYGLYLPLTEEWNVVIFPTWQTLPEIFPESLSIFNLSYKFNNDSSSFRSFVLGPSPASFKLLSLGRSLLIPQ